MATMTLTLTPSREFRDEFLRRSGGNPARCFQCATCSAACDLTVADTVFPRRQILWAQWGLRDRILADPSIWLCHQCNDCSVRCPRDAKPGDAMQAIRSLAVEELAAPRLAAKLVGRARVTWPLLLGLPVLAWALFIAAVNGFAIPRTPLVYGDVVPVWMIYTAFLPAAAFAAAAALLGARRSWAAWGEGARRNGSLLRGLAGAAADVLSHRRLRSCGAARPRWAGHFLLMWGFLGALATTSLLGVLMDGFGVKTPLPQVHPVKLLGNASAVLLGVGAIWLAANRAGGEAAGRSRAFDVFLLAQVVLVVFTGIGAELGRLFLPAPVALGIYVVHLGSVLSLFLTFPFSKLAHAMHRTLALAHHQVTAQRRAT